MSRTKSHAALMILMICLLLIIWSCNSDEDSVASDGDTDSDKHAAGDTDANPDGDIDMDAGTDADTAEEEAAKESEAESAGECEGSCDRTKDTTKCVNDGADVCVCEDGQWMLYCCEDACNVSEEDPSTTTDGCGDAGLDYAYCICILKISESDCSIACTQDVTAQFCDTENENILCVCNPETGEYEFVNCVTYCKNLGYCGSKGCGAAETDKSGPVADVCLCDPGECWSIEDSINSRIGDGCICTKHGTVCSADCQINMCDCTAGIDACTCLDINLDETGSNNGVCLDIENLDPDCIVGESCGGSEERICLQNSNTGEKYCMDTCTLPENTCEPGEYCAMLTGDNDEIVGGGCMSR